MTIVDNIDRYVEKNGTTVQAFERNCGMAHGTVYRWRRGDQMPSLRTMEKIKAATGISIDRWNRRGGVR